MSALYQVYVRNAAMQRAAEIEDFQALDVTLEDNGASRWMVTLPIGHGLGADAANAAQQDGAGVVIVRNGAVLLSGPIRNRRITGNADFDALTISGIGDTGRLATRLVQPVTNGPPYTSAVSFVASGRSETLMRMLVDVTCGPSAKPERRMTGLTLATDLARGALTSVDVRFGPLWPELKRLAYGVGADLGFRVVQVGLSTTLQFQVYGRVDRTSDVIFSREIGNMQAFTHEVAIPTWTHLYMGGSGEGTSRLFSEWNVPTHQIQWGERVEAFRDRREITTQAALDAAILEEAASASENFRTALTLDLTETEAARYGVDYGLGDIVTARAGSMLVQDAIRTVQFKLDASGAESVRPVIGSPDSLPANTPAIFARVGSLARQVNRLETSV